MDHINTGADLVGFFLGPFTTLLCSLSKPTLEIIPHWPIPCFVPTPSTPQCSQTLPQTVVSLRDDISCRFLIRWKVTRRDFGGLAISWTRGSSAWKERSRD